MRPTVILCVFASVVSAPATISSQPQAAPTFEVASVKPNVSKSDAGSSNGNPGTFSVVNLSLRRVIGIAYRISAPLIRDRIVGPAWIDSSRFDITARLAQGADTNRVPEMLKALLAERFALTAHVEMRDISGYALVRARKDDQLGPQLTRSSLDCSRRDDSVSRSVGDVIRSATPTCTMASAVDANGGILRGGGRTMDDLARNLTGQVRRTVIDRTGMSGTYDFILRWTPENFQSVAPEAGPSRDGTSILTALQEQLGLKLEEERVPTEFLIIDRVERPTPD
jgi:uncharacterized protein (TIGR03435 family)